MNTNCRIVNTISLHFVVLLNTEICVFSMKYFLSLIFILSLSIHTNAQFITNVYWTDRTAMDTNDAIYYDLNKKLVWKDFKGTPGGAGPVAAITSSGFGYKADMKTNGTKGQINIGVYCFFSKGKSWVKPGRTTPYILNHEQHHFNVSYLAALFFIDKVKKTVITPANSNNVLPALYREACDLMNKMQSDYDGQTKNGQVVEMQEKWNNFFAERLQPVTK